MGIYGLPSNDKKRDMNLGKQKDSGAQIFRDNRMGWRGKLRPSNSVFWMITSETIPREHQEGDGIYGHSDLLYSTMGRGWCLLHNVETSLEAHRRVFS